MLKNNFVIAQGLDCDGFNNGHINKFKYSKDAVNFCNSCNESSDGLQYSVVNKEIAAQYCETFNIQIPTYFITIN